MDGRRIQLELHFDPLSVVFEEVSITETAERHLVGVWEKVQVDILL